MPDDAIQVDGLKELKKQLREVDASLTKELRRELRSVSQTAERAIRSNVPVGPARGGHWRTAIRAGATPTSAYVTWGRASVPYAPWLEFGGTLRRRRPVSGGFTSIPRTRTPQGRYVFPVVRRLQPLLERQAEAALDRVIRKAGF